jgi:hypothetical protein
MDIDNLISILQASIAPVVLISGVGLLLLSLTNRLGRSIDRVRQLCDRFEKKPGNSGVVKQQIDIVYRRCRYLRTSIVLSIACIFCVSIIIIALFSMHLFQINFIGLVEVVFAAGIVSLILSLLFFLMEVWAALHSLRLEIDHTFSVKD